jgi:hypothetical protein
MSTTPQTTNGTVLAMADAGGTVFTNVAFLRSISQESTRPAVDITHLGSTAREYLMGLRDGGEVTFEVLLAMADATQNASTGLDAVHIAGTFRNFRIIPANSTRRLAFSAAVQSIGVSAGGTDDPLSRSVTLRVTGGMTPENHP